MSTKRADISSTLSRLRRTLPFFMLLMLSTAVVAQEPELTVRAPSQVVEGQQFRVVFSINADGKGFQGPDFKGLSVLSGPNPSTRSNIQMNGRGQMIRSFTKSFTYFLLANQQGEFTVGAASIKVDGKTFSSSPFKIKVVQGQPQQQNNRGKQGTRRPANQNNQKISEDEVFLRATVNKTDPYLGEEVIITYRIYTNRQINLPNAIQQPSFPGFWTEDLLKGEKQYRQSEETYNGRQYVVVDYKKIALFSQKTGEIRIDPFEMEVIARVQSSRRSGDPFFDNFFGGSFFNSYQNVSLKLKSNPVILNVKPLPSQGRPAGFSGAVGNFTLSAEADRESLKANEAVTLKYTLSGNGNIMLVDAPDVSFPPDFELYDPKVYDNIQTNRGGVSGSRAFEYLAIARAPGIHEIKPVSFSYFDPDKEEYISLQTRSFELQVEKGEGESGRSITAVDQEDIRFIGSDIRYIKTGDFKLDRREGPLFFTTTFLLLLLIPLILFILTLILWRKRIAFLQDRSAVRNRRATRLARRQLKKARILLSSGNKEGYYDSVSQALWGYLGDKFDLSLSDLTMDAVSDKLHERGIPEEDIQELREIIDNAEFARFAPGGSQGARQDIYDRSLNIISKLENQLG